MDQLFIISSANNPHCFAADNECRTWTFERAEAFLFTDPYAFDRTSNLIRGNAVNKHAVPAVECPTCKRPEGARNHVPGCIFVGWGHGWQPCSRCGGCALVPADSVEASS